MKHIAPCDFGYKTILPPAITTSLYFLIFGHFIGHRIGVMSGLSYVNFIAPGLIMMTMLTASFSAAVSVVYMAKWTRTIEEILISPMSAINITVSYLFVGVLRGLIVGIIVGTIAICFTDLAIKHIVYMSFTAILACAIFSLFGIINGLLAKSFEQISIIPTFVIIPLTYLGGVFYSINILPLFWQKAAFFNPVIYIISTFRYAFYGHTDTNIFLSTTLMLIIFLIFFCLAVYMFNKRTGLTG